MAAPIVFTGVRLMGEKRNGAKLAIAGCFSDGAGNFYRVDKVTKHFTNGDYYIEYTYTGFDGDPFEETDTDYDPFFNGGTDGSGYGSPDGDDTHEFSEPISESGVSAHWDGMAVTWEDWEDWFDLKTNSTATAHAYYSGTTGTLSSTSYEITTTDAGFEGGPSTIQAESVHLQGRCTVLTPQPCKITYTNGSGAPAVQTLIPGVPHTFAEVQVEEDATHSATLSALQWLPWAA